MTQPPPTFRVDFNELLEPDLVLLSKGDDLQDSAGRVVTLCEGMPVRVWDEDLGDGGERDDLVADGVVERNRASGWSQHVKWCCRIGPAGISHQSDREPQ